MATARISTGESVTIKSAVIRGPDGVTRATSNGFARDASNVLRSVFTSLSATVLPDTVQAFAYSNAAATARTEQAVVSVVPVGGAYTYVWSRVDSNPGAWAILSPTSNRTAFEAPSLANGEYRGAIFRCTVSGGGTSVTVDVLASAENYGRDTGNA